MRVNRGTDRGANVIKRVRASSSMWCWVVEGVDGREGGGVVRNAGQFGYSLMSDAADVGRVYT